MLIDNKSADSRLSSPMNLMNKLKSMNKKNNPMDLFTNGLSKKDKSEPKTFNPFIHEEPQAPVTASITPPAKLVKTNTEEVIKETTTIDSILDSSDAKIKLGLAHDKALNLLHSSVQALADKLDDVKAEKLPSVITAASKVVEGIRRERNEAAKTDKDRAVHYHFYTPQQRTVTDYEVIDVGVSQ